MGGEKVLSALGWLPHHQAGAGSEECPETAPQEVERRIVASATRTDLILSSEIMLVSMAGLAGESAPRRVAILIAVAFFMTFFVYGLVALLVKMDDFGLRLARAGAPEGAAADPMENRPGPVDNVGRVIVRAMPRVFRVIGVVGTVAMLWVGGPVVIASLGAGGPPAPHHVVAAAEHAVAGAGGFAQWCAESFLSGVFGLALGGFLALVWAVARRLVRRKR